MALFKALYDLTPQGEGHLPLLAGRLYMEDLEQKVVPNWIYVVDTEAATAGYAHGYAPANYLAKTERQGVMEIPLTALSIREGTDVPAVLSALIGRLRAAGGCQATGIFRYPGNHKKTVEAQEALDALEDPAAVVSDLSVGDCASLLGRWARNLPVKLVAYPLDGPEYNRLISLAGEVGSRPIAAAEAWGLLADMPAPHLESLKVFAGFVGDIEETAIPGTHLAKMLAPDFFGSPLAVPSPQAPHVNMPASPLSSTSFLSSPFSPSGAIPGPPQNHQHTSSLYVLSDCVDLEFRGSAGRPERADRIH